MNSGTYCPFCNSQCRSDCVFRMSALKNSDSGFTYCLIASRLSEINENQSDELNEICNKLDK